MPTLPVSAPAGYIPIFALAYSSSGGDGVPVDAGHPLPVSATLVAASSTPVDGSAGASVLAGPFSPDLGRPVWLTLSGTWSGSVAVLRSIDGGATMHPLTAGGEAWGLFTANACEQIAEETEAGATWYLDITLAAGTLTYRVAQ